jgi:Tol biopolymer transport system component
MKVVEPRIVFGRKPDGYFIMKDDGSKLEEWRYPEARPAVAFSATAGALYSYSRPQSDLRVERADNERDYEIYFSGKRLTDNSSEDQYPMLSPQEDRVAFTALENDGSYQLRVVPTAGSCRERVLFNGGRGLTRCPVWSPDGKRLALYAYDAGPPEVVKERQEAWGRWRQEDKLSCALYVVNVDGTGLAKLTTGTGECLSTTAWSPDGRWIAYSMGQLARGTDRDLFGLYLVDSKVGTGKKLIEGASVGGFGFSPDSKRIVFSASGAVGKDKPGMYEPDIANDEIFIVGVDGAGLRKLTNTWQNEESPQWIGLE